ncbi:double-strand break repair helicase AddA [Palleronia sp. KMU-117]|uniref:double-strand break repair helicase AddA n=1 Tax=Palleronia sp. KMU-117 TaxID=3434108 RepID=UPI003D738F90
MTPPNEATLRQHQAAAPDRSTWLAANAGSGKTRVLTDRVARLLLEGVDPQNILCLTYTKAAAAEMQNRLLGRLGAWAMLDDAALTRALAEIGVAELDDLGRARTLFARALETPGGLKIQTIHAFCASILRRFPLEAGVSPQFTEIDDAQTRALLSEVLEALAEGPARGRLDAIAQQMSVETLEDLGREVLSNRDGFARPLGRDEALALFDLPPGFDLSRVEHAAFAPGDAALLSALVPVLAAGSPTDQKAGERLSPLAGRPLTVDDLQVLEGVLLFGEGAKAPFGSKAGAFPTKATRLALGSVTQTLDDLMDRIATARPLRLALAAAEKTRVVHDFAAAFLPAYDRAKADRGWLDFDDLIARTRALLRHAPAAAWVLYKLDGGIDHILVDEAQDTSPAQWDVIAALAEEIAAGAGSRPDAPRTLFVVGDKKQSIYSFQGARPEAFEDMHGLFRDRLRGNGGLQRLQLQYSFRSSAAVLSAVDRTYRLDDDGQDGQRHRAFNAALPGRVDLWPVMPPESIEDPDDWWNPIDLQGADHHNVRLARAIADFIRDTIATGTLPEKDGTRRPVHAGDFLVLVQRRTSGLFNALIHACKAAGLPIAGADRLRLSAELAVRDVLSVLRFLALPEDDLALAEALRSPLLGWSEDALFRLAHGRDGYLWVALRQARDRHPETIAFLEPLLDKADYQRPYELVEEILTGLGGREKLIARMGAEVEDGLDELLNQTLRYEMTEVPSLTGFLDWQQSGEVEVKRQAEGAGAQMRVMTVHGAKGLESPIVILPDTLRTDRERRSELVMAGDTALWRVSSAESPPAIAKARRTAAEADQAERRRLLYVAMTRAERWLVVCGAGERKPDGATWYDEIERGLTEAGAVPHPMPTGEGLRLAHGDWSAGPLVSAPTGTDAGGSIDDWMTRRAEPAQRAARPLSPSDLGGAKVLPGEGVEGDPAAMERGTILHALLEHLPGCPIGMRASLAQAVLDGLGLPLVSVEGDVLVAHALRLIDDPALAHVFADGTLAEVPIFGHPEGLGGRAVAGTIDRLLVAPETVLAVDYKSNRLVPDRVEDTPEGLLRQMGAYAALLAGAYPGRRIETAILWMATGRLMPLPHEMVMEAFRRTAIS